MELCGDPEDDGWCCCVCNKCSSCLEENGPGTPESDPESSTA